MQHHWQLLVKISLDCCFLSLAGSRPQTKQWDYHRILSQDIAVSQKWNCHKHILQEEPTALKRKKRTGQVKIDWVLSLVSSAISAFGPKLFRVMLHIIIKSWASVYLEYGSLNLSRCEGQFNHKIHVFAGSELCVHAELSKFCTLSFVTRPCLLPILPILPVSMYYKACTCEDRRIAGTCFVPAMCTECLWSQSDYCLLHQCIGGLSDCATIIDLRHLSVGMTADSLWLIIEQTEIALHPLLSLFIFDVRCCRSIHCNRCSWSQTIHNYSICIWNAPLRYLIGISWSQHHTLDVHCSRLRTYRWLKLTRIQRR